MTRIVSVLSTLSLALLSIGAVAPAMAAGPHYRAELATPSTASSFVARGLIWRCGTAGCFAGKSNSRPAIACAGLAREAGALRSFTVAGKALSADELEKCNAKAK